MARCGLILTVSRRLLAVMSATDLSACAAAVVVIVAVVAAAVITVAIDLDFESVQVA